LAPQLQPRSSQLQQWLPIRASQFLLIRMDMSHEAAKEAAFIRSHGRAVLIATGIDAMTAIPTTALPQSKGGVRQRRRAPVHSFTLEVPEVTVRLAAASAKRRGISLNEALLRAIIYTWHRGSPSKAMDFALDVRWPASGLLESEGGLS
jgi:hypothetical protein